MTLEAQRSDVGEQALLAPPARSLESRVEEVVSKNQLSAGTPVRTRAPRPQELPRGPRPVEVPAEREDSEAERHDDGDDKPQKSLPLGRPFAVVIGLVLSALVATGGYLYWDHAQHFQSTDDAFIAARQFTVSPKVTGYITAVPVCDNQHLAAGDAIVRIDDRDFRIALEQARAQVTAAQASIANSDAQISVQQAQISAGQAQVDQAEAALVFAQQQAARYEKLAQTGAGTVQNAQQYASQLRQQTAALASARAGLNVAQRQLEALKAQRDSAVASLAQAQAQRDQAELNLSYTTVTAAQPGRVVNLSAAVGQFAQSGTNLAMFVPDQIWVTANFKETQLNAMRPAEPVMLSIDAYPERTLTGHLTVCSQDPAPRSRSCQLRMPLAIT